MRGRVVGPEVQREAVARGGGRAAGKRCAGHVRRGATLPRLAAAGLVLATLLVVATQAAGQSAGPAEAGVRRGPGAAAPRFATGNDARAAARLNTPAPVPRLVAGGVLGGALGGLSVGFAGAMIGGNSCGDVGNPDSCRGIQGLLIGIAVGESIGVPLGTHLAGRRRGRLAPALLASAAIGAVTAGVIAANVEGGHALILVAPAAQIGASAWIERRTAR
jgi:hypothetical protein